MKLVKTKTEGAKIGGDEAKETRCQPALQFYTIFLLSFLLLERKIKRMVRWWYARRSVFSLIN
jgi:hypothetical protein